MHGAGYPALVSSLGLWDPEPPIQAGTCSVHDGGCDCTSISWILQCRHCNQRLSYGLWRLEWCVLLGSSPSSLCDLSIMLLPIILPHIRYAQNYTHVAENYYLGYRRFPRMMLTAFTKLSSTLLRGLRYCSERGGLWSCEVMKITDSPMRY